VFQYRQGLEPEDLHELGITKQMICLDVEASALFHGMQPIAGENGFVGSNHRQELVGALALVHDEQVAL